MVMGLEGNNLQEPWWIGTRRLAKNLTMKIIEAFRAFGTDIGWPMAISDLSQILGSSPTKISSNFFIFRIPCLYLNVRNIGRDALYDPGSVDLSVDFRMGRSSRSMGISSLTDLEKIAEEAGASPPSCCRFHCEKISRTICVFHRFGHVR